MTYDTMNRVQTKSYSDGTPSVTYCCDVSTGAPGCGNAPSGSTRLADRLTMVTSSVSTTKYPAYDEIGDVTASSQTTNGQTYPFTYSYNLLGGMTQAVYPSGRTVNTA